MEHEVFVPFPPGTIREALRDPARVTRSLHGFQPDSADEPPHTLTGRLRFRIGGSTITYRGALSLTEHDSGLSAEGEAAEARGSGTVKIAVGVAVAPAEGGAVLTFTGTVRPSGAGRLAEQDPDAVAVAGRRLLDRFVAELTAGLPAAEPDVVDDGAEAAALEEAAAPEETAESGAPEEAAESAVTEEAAESVTEEAAESAATGELTDEGAGTGHGLPEGVTVPESAAELDPLPEDLEDLEDLAEEPPEPPAEAAHARRTMIGRSAEEVDHAPPRGRYAPVPTPDAGSGRVTLRWAAPAAAALIASAVVVGRVLRRRR